MEKTIQLDLPVLLSGGGEQCAVCQARLESALQNQKGLGRAHLERQRQPPVLCLHYEAGQLSPAQVQRLAENAGAQIAARYRHLRLPVEGMDCSDCARVIEHSLGRIEGVLAVEVSYAAQELRLEYDNEKTGRAALEKRVRSLGYEIPLNGLMERVRPHTELLASLAAGLLLLLGWLGERFWGLPSQLSIALYLGAYILGGWEAAGHAWRSLRRRRFDTDLLMLMAALGAAFLGQFAEGALLLFLFSLGHALEERALNRARAAVRALADLAPKTALARRQGLEIELPVEALQLGELVIVRPGVRIPVDGVILAGRSAVNQAPVTGESLPVEKAPGDPVFAGTVNGDGALEVTVTRLAKDSTLSRVMIMVEQAQEQKSPTQQTVERFERVFVPAVLALTLLVMLVPPLLGYPFQESFLRAMTLLVAASPCALALGAPAAILAGVAQAARSGVLVKGGVHLENLGRLKAVAFDKTGTITHGKPAVTGILALPGAGWSEADLLALAAGVEGRAAHPFAQAVVQAARQRGLAPYEVEAVEAQVGRGLVALYRQKPVWIGSRELIEEAGIELGAGALERAAAFQAEGQSVMWIATQQGALGLLALADTLRPEAAATVQALHKAGIAHTIMLTGDNPQAAAAIAAQAGLSEVRAGLLPEQKLSAIEALVEQYQQVAMVGDGVNDAPALANATVGIAMGGAATDVALETADVALMGDDLARLPFAVALGRATRRIIMQNLAIALGVIALLIGASLTGLVSIGAAVILHEGSTLVVVANALRLLAFKTK
jgi:Cd2+/Zn2+-exporting ATPase